MKCCSHPKQKGAGARLLEKDPSCPRTSVRDMQSAFQCRRSYIKLTGEELKFKEVATTYRAHMNYWGPRRFPHFGIIVYSSEVVVTNTIKVILLYARVQM
jgi:hypothetical protein